MIGFAWAILTILLFGSWAVPTIRLSVSSQAKALWVTVGHLILSVSLFVATAQHIALGHAVLPFGAGVIWALGITAAFGAIREIGITRAVGTWIPIIIVVSALWGLVYFGEWSGLNLDKRLFTFAALAVLTAAALLVVRSTEDVEKRALGNVRLGIGLAAIVGVAHGSFFVPIRNSSDPIYATFLPFTLGMVTTTGLLAAYRRTQVWHGVAATVRMMFSGGILGAGNYAALQTTLTLGVSTGYPLTELSIVVNTFWGILYFREVPSRKGRVLVGAGVALALAGAVLVSLAHPT